MGVLVVYVHDLDAVRSCEPGKMGGTVSGPSHDGEPEGGTSGREFVYTEEGLERKRLREKEAVMMKTAARKYRPELVRIGDMDDAERVISSFQSINWPGAGTMESGRWSKKHWLLALLHDFYAKADVHETPSGELVFRMYRQPMFSLIDSVMHFEDGRKIDLKTTPIEDWLVYKAWMQAYGHGMPVHVWWVDENDEQCVRPAWFAAESSA